MYWLLYLAVAAFALGCSGIAKKKDRKPGLFVFFAIILTVLPLIGGLVLGFVISENWDGAFSAFAPLIFSIGGMVLGGIISLIIAKVAKPGVPAPPKYVQPLVGPDGLPINHPNGQMQQGQPQSFEQDIF